MAGTNEKANVITFCALSCVTPDYLPRAILSWDYVNEQRKRLDLKAPYTIYDQWGMALSGIDLAKSYFSGEVKGCELLQVATDEERRILDGLYAICRDQMKRSYSSSRAAVSRWLRAKGAPIDETTFDSSSRY